MRDQKRVPAGSPEGGQFASSTSKLLAAARQLGSKQEGSGPVTAVLYRAGPTNNPTGSGIRFGTHTSASIYGKVYKVPPKRYLVKLKNPLHVQGDVFDAAKKLKVPGVTLEGYRRASDKGQNDTYWKAADAKVHAAAVKKGHDGLVMKSPSPLSKTYHSVEVVAFKARGSVRELVKLKAKIEGGTK